MKTLILTDIHQELEWANHILETEEYDEVIINGDTLDTRNPHHPNTASFNQTIKTLINWKIKKYKIHPGNHDASYIEEFNRRQRGDLEHAGKLMCSGFSEKQFAEFRAALANVNLTPELLYEDVLTQINDIVISHAGLHEDLGTHADLFTHAFEEVKKSKWADAQPQIFAIGYSRGGYHKKGGCLWRDEDDEPSEFPCHQIFGHTGSTGRASVRYTKNNFLHVNLDGNHRTYGILEDQILTIKSKKHKEYNTFTFNEIKGFGGNIHENCKQVIMDFNTQNVSIVR